MGFPSPVPACASVFASDPFDDVGNFFSGVGRSVSAAFSPSEASARAHRHVAARCRAVHRNAARSAAPPPPGWAVPQGALAASAIASPGAATRFVEWDGTAATLEAAAHAGTGAKASQGAASQGGTPKGVAPQGAPPWAAVLLDGAMLAQACREGWLRPVEGVPNCGLPGGQADVALAWDRSRQPNPPVWADFWDVARHPGRRGLHFGARTTLEIALLADGVDPSDIYAALSTPQGVDRAFHKLDLLRPYIVWWRTPDDAGRIMAESGALMIGAPAAEISAVSARVKAGPAASIFVAQPEMVLREGLFWAVPANVPDPLAQETIAGLRASAPRFDDMPGPTARGARFLLIDESFWIAHGAALEQRFSDWYESRRP